MNKKILFCASTTSHINNFHLPYLKAFHEMGYQVWVAVDKSEPIQYVDKVIAIPFCKKFFSFHNIKAIFEVKDLLKEEKFDFISTHTTLASAVVRAAVMQLHCDRPEVFNTVHGYLFNESDGLKKWKYLLPEKICASVTDVLMVMNHEDYDIAEKHKLYRGRLYYIDGMGIDLSKFTSVSQDERSALKKKQGFSEHDFLFVYAAEFSKRKNQSLLIRAFANICTKIPNTKLLLAGDGLLLEECKTLAKELHVQNQVQFLGYVEDMRKLYAICDICVTTSCIEGLPFNVMEAMACGLPVIASDIKGHRELVEAGKTGLLFENGNQKELEEKLKLLYLDISLQEALKCKSQKIVKRFELRSVLDRIMMVYVGNSES